jgi:hypothetical protein
MSNSPFPNYPHLQARRVDPFACKYCERDVSQRAACCTAKQSWDCQNATQAFPSIKQEQESSNGVA